MKNEEKVKRKRKKKYISKKTRKLQMKRVARRDTKQLTVGGDKLMVEPRRSWGPILECRRVGSPLPGVPPGDEAHDGAMRIFGVISVLSESRRLGNTLPTRRKLLSGEDGEQPNHQPPSMPEPVQQN